MEVEDSHQLESFVAKDSISSNFEFESNWIFNTEYLNTEMKYLSIYLPVKLMLQNLNNPFLPFIINVRCQKRKIQVLKIQLLEFQVAQHPNVDFRCPRLRYKIWCTVYMFANIKLNMKT